MSVGVRFHRALRGFPLIVLLALLSLSLLVQVGCDDEESSASDPANTSSSEPQVAGLTDESGHVPRYINIVYDDSTSMNQDEAWCRAHYALEVFAAMLDSNDVMKVFTMSAADNNKSEPDIIVEGDWAIEKRRNIVHDVFSEKDAYSTPNR